MRQAVILIGLFFGAHVSAQASDSGPASQHVVSKESLSINPKSNKALDALAEAALARTRVSVTYDGRYRKLDYPGGDVPNHLGVCSDVVIRAYRALGIDLQVSVHRDMKQHFDEYPDRWGLTAPDPNIDHRRVPNLERFFTRMGAARPTTRRADYRAGDVVSWRLENGAPHIGIVQSRRSDDGKRPLIVHNIGRGPVVEDVLFAYPLYGHFRYWPAR